LTLFHASHTIVDSRNNFNLNGRENAKSFIPMYIDCDC
jgi:hypothetical protein